VRGRPVLAAVAVLAVLPAVALAQIAVSTPESEESSQLVDVATTRFTVDLAALRAEEGRTVESVEFEGRRVTREGVLAREIHTRAGEPLEVAMVLDDLQRLQNMQIFSEVGVTVDAGDDERVRVRYVVKEMNSWLPTLAAQYTEENGLSIGPGVSALNLTGRNIRVTGSAIFGGTTQYWVDFNWPWITGHHVGLRGRAAHLDRYDNLNEFQESSNELALRPSRFLGEHGRLGVGFQLLTVASDQPGKTLSPTNDDLLISLEASIGWDTRDAWNNPTGGWLNEVVVSKTGGALGGEGDFWGLIVDLRRWQPTARRQRLLLSGLMSLQSGEVGVDIPEYLQYRLGGANTIRGYSIEELGRVLYGRNQLLGTVEYAFRVVPMRRFDFWKLSFRLGLELALFTDVGIAWNEGRDLNLKRTRAGGGAGVRLLVPGSDMARIDVGWSPEEGFHLHFAGGSKPSRQRMRLR
jgi:outer membrane protein insertion porin family